MRVLSQQFSGIWVPLVTPFNVQGDVDHGALAKLVKLLANVPVAGFVVCGTTGEPAALDDSEKVAVLQTVLTNCAGLPVVMGISGITPKDVCRQVAQWQAMPIAGFLLPPPYYVRPSSQGIVNFYTDVARSSQLPLIVYDIPYRTGAQLELDTLRKLAEISGIRAIKDCGGNARKTQALIDDGQLQVLAGEDHLIFTTLCQGGAGAIAASAHLHPALFVAMYQAIRSGDLSAARKLHHALASMIDTLFVEPNPAPLKAVLATLGYLQPILRSPLMAATAQVVSAASAAYARLADR